jgi:cell filamentation protein
VQGAWQPGSNEQVLANKLGITRPEDMADAELELLRMLYQEVMVDALPEHGLRVDDLKRWHRLWLGNVYEWAGEERAVTMSKDGFPFAAATQIPQLLRKFEADYLGRYTPCDDMDEEQLVEAIALTHVELILIHPFREGNGRLSRLLADVMAVQAGVGPLDYSSWDADKAGYIAAIHQGMVMNYEPMKAFVRQALAAVRNSGPV